MLSLQTLVLFLIIASVYGHMQMSYPPALRYKGNPYSGDDVDYSLTNPLSSSGSDFPCHGSLDLLGTSKATPVASWTAGETYNMTITGGAPHNGGSCQASLSHDNGKTFTVIHSYIGGCPSGSESSFSFRVPADAPPSDSALFAWTWQNKVGNREMYMNCAVVKLARGSGAVPAGGVPLGSRPGIFEVNIGNGCQTPQSANLLYPNPGPDVDVNDPGAVPAIGSCETASSGSSGSSGTSPGSSSGDTSVAPGSSASAGGSPSPGSDPSESSGGGSGSDTFVPGNHWPEGFSLAGRHRAAGIVVVTVILVHLMMLTL